MQLFSSKADDSHVSKYVCQMDHMSKVLFPANLDVVSAEDVFGATIEQFCGLPDHITKQVLPVLLRNFNYTLLVDEVSLAQYRSFSFSSIDLRLCYPIIEIKIH